MSDEPCMCDTEFTCLADHDDGMSWGWDGSLPFTEEVTRIAAATGYQETSELRA